MGTQGNAEDLNDNLEARQTADNPQNQEEETYKQRYSNSTREAQKLIETNNKIQEELLINKNARLVLADPSKLLDLDEKTGKEVVKLLHSEGNATTDSYEEILNSLKPKDKETTSLNKEDLYKEFKTRELKEQAQEVVATYLEKLPQEKRDKLIQEYKELGGDQISDPKKAKKLIEQIDLYSRKDEIEAEKKDSALAQLAATGIRHAQTEKQPKKSVIDFAKRVGMSEREMKDLGLIS